MDARFGGSRAEKLAHKGELGGWKFCKVTTPKPQTLDLDPQQLSLETPSTKPRDLGTERWAHNVYTYKDKCETHKVKRNDLNLVI